MKKAGNVLVILLSMLIFTTSYAVAATDGYYQLSEITSAWDGTDANRTKAPTADYDYTYGDEASVTYTLPWSFSFYGTAYNQINVDTNGNIWFGFTGSTHSINLPSTGKGPVISAWNNDLSSYYYGGVFVQHKVNPERVVIEWQTETYTEEGYYKPNNVEVILFQNGTFRIDYKTFNTSFVKDFGSGISKDDGSTYLIITSNYANVPTLAGRSFAFGDIIPPAVSIDPAPSLTNGGATTLSGTVEAGAEITVAADTAATIGEITYPTHTTWSCQITDLPEETTTFTITATDFVRLTTTATASITRDSTPPNVTISSPVGYVKTATPQLLYTVNDGAVVVKVDGAVVNKVSGDLLNLLVDGPHSVRIESTDAATNAGSAESIFVVDTIVPVLTVNQTVSPTNAASLILSGTIESGATVIVTATTAASIGTVAYPTATSWECVVSSLAAGDNVFTVSATDAAGNTTTFTVTINYIPSVSLALSTGSIASDYRGNIGLSIGNISPIGSSVRVEQFIDINGNGLVDSNDYLVRLFEVTDGIASNNANVQGDEDGIANATVITGLNYFLADDLYHAPGSYLFRVVKGFQTAVAAFAVTPVTQPQSISGTVTDGINPVPGAMVRLLDKWQRAAGFTVADAAGQYTLQIKEPGAYSVVPLAYGYVAPSAPTSIIVAAGQTAAGHDLVLIPGAYRISGIVKKEGALTGIGGVLVQAKGSNYTGIAMSSDDGAYDLALPAGTYEVSALADITMPTATAKGYVVPINQPHQVNLTAEIAGIDISLPPAEVVMSGRVTDALGAAIPGLPVQGKLPPSADLRESIGYGVTNATGDYALGLIGGDAYAVSLHNPAAQILGYIGTGISPYSTTAGPIAGNYLAAYPITAWVQGTVKDSVSKLLGGVEVLLRNSDSSIVTSVTTASDGTYRFGAFAGSWYVDALTENKGSKPVPEQNVMLANDQTATVDFVADVTPPGLTIDPVISPTTVNSQTISGTMEAGATVTVSVDTTAVIGPVTYPTSTTWSCSITNLAETINSITITARDIAGNAATATAQIRYTTVVAPDLVTSALTAPSAANTEQTIIINITSKNMGTATAGYHAVTLYLSTDDIINGSDTILTGYPVSNLAPDAEFRNTISIKIPVVNSGTFYIGVIADSRNEVAELDEGNNGAVIPITITKLYPDLSTTGLTVPPSANTEGAVTINITTKNIGQAAAGYHAVTLYLSTDSEVTTSDTVLTGYPITNLAPGAEAVRALSVTIPIIAGGTYYIGAIADSRNEVQESNEANNIAASPITITRLHPDLITSEVIAPLSATAASTTMVGVTTKNTGQGTAGYHAVTIYLSPDSEITATDTILTGYTIARLNPGAEDFRNITVNIPVVTTGTYYIGAIVDSRNEVVESNEGNNSLAGSPTIIN